MIYISLLYVLFFITLYLEKGEDEDWIVRFWLKIGLEWMDTCRLFYEMICGGRYPLVYTTTTIL